MRKGRGREWMIRKCGEKKKKRISEREKKKNRQTDRQTYTFDI